MSPNPILPGFYPDPSCCRVGEDYWLVNSSFALFPGLPLHHSRDLMHWRPVGHVLDRPEQLDLDGVEHSQGQFAPTIRHYRGTFYVIGTNVGKGECFLVTSTDPAGEWSDPVWLDAPGIDPSLFFDEGKAWFCGTRPAPEGERYRGNWEVWARELDLGLLALKGPEFPLWRGALLDCVWPEGPHLYRRGDWYYLTIAEGGTGSNHAVSVARSRSVTGPFEGFAANPILTHRHLGHEAGVVNVGHGDLVEDHRGRWWLVHLASRPYGGVSPLGRETFLTPVDWVDDWPRPALGQGVVPPQVDTGLERPPLSAPLSACDPFDSQALDLRWVGLRTPRRVFADLLRRPGWLSLSPGSQTLRDQACPAFLGQRLRWRRWQALTKLEFSPRHGLDAAGLALVQGPSHQFRLEAGVGAGRPQLRLVGAEGGSDEVLATLPWDGGGVVLAVTAEDHELTFWTGPDTARLKPLATTGGQRLSTERAGGFVGTLAGVFATGPDPTVWAEFDWFELSGTGREIWE